MKLAPLSWQEIPAIRLVLPLILGGTLYLLFPGYTLPKILLLIFLIILITAQKWGKVWALTFYALTACWGYLHFQHNDQAYATKHDKFLDSTFIQKIVINSCKWDEDRNRWRGEGESYIPELEGKSINIYFWIERSDSTQLLKAGDSIIGKFDLKQPRRNEIPGAFNFRKYLQGRNIAYTTYIPDYTSYEIKRSRSSSPFSGLKQWKRKKMKDMANYTDSLTLSLLKAILFGDNQSLAPAVREQFANAGIAHVLAVSGMHVGILVLIIQFMIKRLGRRLKWKATLDLLLTLPAVWLYITLCDFAPSATRAAIMVSIYYLGKAFKSKATGLNTLGLSFLILFLWDPFIILDLGAQLSFAAMAGILLTLSFWESLLLRWTPIPKIMVSLIALSFAAQLGVAPFLLYYFGQLPLLFWLFSIPAGYLAIFLFVGGWLLLLFMEVSSLAASYFGEILNTGLAFWTFIMDFFSKEGLPTLKWTYYPVSYLICSVFIITAFIRCIYSHTKRRLFFNLHLITLAFGFLIFYHNWEVNKTDVQKIHLKNQQYTVLKTGSQAYILTDSKIHSAFKSNSSSVPAKKFILRSGHRLFNSLFT
jgi:competence protein ComEC